MATDKSNILVIWGEEVYGHATRFIEEAVREELPLPAPRN